jgi:hypothetical protein
MNRTLPWIVAVQRPRPLRIATPTISSRALPSAKRAYSSALRAATNAVVNSPQFQFATNPA